MEDLEPVILGIVTKISASAGDATVANQTAIAAAIADLITRAKGLDDTHDDVGTVNTVVDAIKVSTDQIPDFTDALLFDDYNDESLSTTIWGTAVSTGTTAIAESSIAPNTLRIYNTGIGTAGYGYIPSILTFGRNVSVRSKIEVYNGEDAGDGERCIGRIELYEDSDNYIYFGPYRDTSAVLNSRGRISYNIDGAGLTNIEADTTDIDNIAREYRIDVTDENILFYIDDILIYTLKDAAINNFCVRQYGETQNNTDNLDIRFDYTKVLRLAEDQRLILKKLLQIQGGEDSIGAIVAALNSSMDLGSSRASTVMTGAEQTLYEESSDTPFTFNGGYIDFTGANAGAGEDTTIKGYIKLKSGGTYRLIYTETYLNAAVPSPIAVPAPRLATDIAPAKLCGMYGIKITATQAAIGAGWNTLYNEWFDEMA